MFVLSHTVRVENFFQFYRMKEMAEDAEKDDSKDVGSRGQRANWRAAKDQRQRDGPGARRETWRR